MAGDKIIIEGKYIEIDRTKVYLNSAFGVEVKQLAKAKLKKGKLYDIRGSREDIEDMVFALSHAGKCRYVACESLEHYDIFAAHGKTWPNKDMGAHVELGEEASNEHKELVKCLAFPEKEKIPTAVPWRNCNSLFYSDTRETNTVEKLSHKPWVVQDPAICLDGTISLQIIKSLFHAHSLQFEFDGHSFSLSFSIAFKFMIEAGMLEGDFGEMLNIDSIHINQIEGYKMDMDGLQIPLFDLKTID